MTVPPTPKPGVLSGEQIRELQIVRLPQRVSGEKNNLGNQNESAPYMELIVKPMSVDLRLGRQFVDCQLDKPSVSTRNVDTSAAIEIPPLGAIIFSTLESLCIPEDVVGRFDLKIAYALQGLVLQVGPQLEPRYEGPLFGLLINLSTSTRSLADDVFLTAEFSKLHPDNIAPESKRKVFRNLKDFLNQVPSVTKELRTTRLAKIEHSLQEYEESVEKLRNEVNSAKSHKFQIIAIVVAVFVAGASLTLSSIGVIVATRRLDIATQPSMKHDPPIAPQVDVETRPSPTTTFQDDPIDQSRESPIKQGDDTEDPTPGYPSSAVELTDTDQTGTEDGGDE